MTGASPQECVGVDVDKENRAPRVDRKSKMPMTNDVSRKIHRTDGLGVMLVRGRLWSANVYKNARLAGLSVDAAWKTSFVQ
jgi:hypothetical protein